MQLLIFVLLSTDKFFEWAQSTVYHFSRTRPFRDFGGLKWTRTIDLTLIRRVL